MASGFMNMLSFWLFFVSCIIMISFYLLNQDRHLQVGQFILPLSAFASGNSWIWFRYDFMVSFYGYIYCFFFDGSFKLCCNSNQHEN